MADRCRNQPACAAAGGHSAVCLIVPKSAARWRQQAVLMSGVTNGRFSDRAKNISYEVMYQNFYISIIIVPGLNAQLFLVKKIQLVKVRMRA